MIIKTTRYRKPDLLLLLAFFVAVGFLATSLAQAAEPRGFLTQSVNGEQTTESESWWQSIWGPGLARSLKGWRPKISEWEVGAAEGFKLARPFGKTGPSLRWSLSLPDSVQRSLREGGDHRIGALSGDTDAYIFLHKHW